MTRRTYPWHDAPAGPCGCGPVGSLEPFGGAARFYGPGDSTLFCPVCGAGWVGTDDQIEQAFIAEVWLDAWQASGKSEARFLRSQRARSPRRARVVKGQAVMFDMESES